MLIHTLNASSTSNSPHRKNLPTVLGFYFWDHRRCRWPIVFRSLPQCISDGGAWENTDCGFGYWEKEAGRASSSRSHTNGSDKVLQPLHRKWWYNTRHRWSGLFGHRWRYATERGLQHPDQIRPKGLQVVRPRFPSASCSNPILNPPRLNRTDRAVLAVNGFAADGNMFVKKVKQRLEV